MKKRRPRLEVFLFSLTMWTVVVCSLGAVLTKAVLGKPRSVPLHYLLGFAMVAALLAMLVPSLESLVLSRVKEVSFGGVKLALIEEAVKDSVLVKYDDILPAGGEEVSFPDLAKHYLAKKYPCDDPFPGPALSTLQQYRYQKLSVVLLVLLARIEDPEDLEQESLENLRRLIKNVGRTASAQKDYAVFGRS